MNQKRYPTNLFFIGLITNILFHYFWLFIPSIVLLIAGIWKDACLLIGIVLLALDVVLSIWEQLKIRKAFLSDSEHPTFQDTLFKKGNWLENAKEVVDQIENHQQ